MFTLCQALSKHIICINTFNSYNNSIRWVLLGRLYDLFKVTRLLSGGVMTCT